MCTSEVMPFHRLLFCWDMVITAGFSSQYLTFGNEQLGFPVFFMPLFLKKNHLLLPLYNYLLDLLWALGGVGSLCCVVPAVVLLVDLLDGLHLGPGAQKGRKDGLVMEYTQYLLRKTNNESNFNNQETVIRQDKPIITESCLLLR